MIFLKFRVVAILICWNNPDDYPEETKEQYPVFINSNHRLPKEFAMGLCFGVEVDFIRSKKGVQ